MGDGFAWRMKSWCLFLFQRFVAAEAFWVGHPHTVSVSDSGVCCFSFPIRTSLISLEGQRAPQEGSANGQSQARHTRVLSLLTHVFGGAGTLIYQTLREFRGSIQFSEGKRRQSSGLWGPWMSRETLLHLAFGALM